MRKNIIKCDRCGFEKQYDADKYIIDELKGWASMVIYGQDKDAEVCPECIKSFIDIKEVKEND